MPKVDLLFITLNSPILVGVYKEDKLIEKVVSEKKSSDILPLLFQELQEKYTIERLFYTNGPGSFMAIKVAYIFLKSMSILKKIPLYATDAFSFNENQPIKAIGKLYFVKVASEIKTQKFESVQEVSFRLPNMLDVDKFSADASPLYKIGAVG